jgi:hypothetical protein
MFKVRWKKFRQYSGPVISGTERFELKQNSNHWDRVIWLIANVESGGKFGATMGYDGTGNTSGLIQGIAVYPRELSHEDHNAADDQGPLWDMIDLIGKDHPELLENLFYKFDELNWSLEDGKILNLNNRLYSSNKKKCCVRGKVIRDELTPISGKVPRFGRKWKQAKEWVILFHEIFNNPLSFDSQVKFGISHVQNVAKRKPKILNGKSIEDIIYSGDLSYSKSFTKGDPMDLAMAFFFSNSVNAPAMAFKKFNIALQVFNRVNNRYPNINNPRDRISFSKRLIRVLGTANFARWSSARYPRTRKAARKVWPKAFFTEKQTGVMPYKF